MGLASHDSPANVPYLNMSQNKRVKNTNQGERRHAKGIRIAWAGRNRFIWGGGVKEERNVLLSEHALNLTCRIIVQRRV